MEQVINYDIISGVTPIIEIYVCGNEILESSNFSEVSRPVGLLDSRLTYFRNRSHGRSLSGARGG